MVGNLCHSMWNQRFFLWFIVETYVLKLTTTKQMFGQMELKYLLDYFKNYLKFDIHMYLQKNNSAR